MPRRLEPLPIASSSVRTAIVTDRAQQLIFPNPDRRFYLIQNQDAVDSLLITSTQNGQVGQIIGPTGAKIVDAPTVNAIWGKNLTGATGISVVVEEIVGYSPYEIRMLLAMEQLVELIQHGKR